jgi:hypothetical protein
VISFQHVNVPLQLICARFSFEKYVTLGSITYDLKPKILEGKSKGKRARGRPRHKWEENIKIYLKEIGWDDVNWVHLVQDRDIKMKLRVP